MVLPQGVQGSVATSGLEHSGIHPPGTTSSGMELCRGYHSPAQQGCMGSAHSGLRCRQFWGGMWLPFALSIQMQPFLGWDKGAITAPGSNAAQIVRTWG